MLAAARKLWRTAACPATQLAAEYRYVQQLRSNSAKPRRARLQKLIKLADCNILGKQRYAACPL